MSDMKGNAWLVKTEEVASPSPTPDELAIQELLKLPDDKIQVPAVGKYLKALARLRT